MSYRNPKQFLDPTGNPIAEGLSKGFSLWEAKIKEDRIKQEEIQKESDAEIRARANNILKMPGARNPEMQKQLMAALRTETDELVSLKRTLSDLSGDDRINNLIRQEEIQQNVSKYGEYVVTLNYLENKLSESLNKNANEEGYISKATGANIQELILAYKNRDPKVKIVQENGYTFLTKEGLDFKLDLQNATDTLAAGQEIIKTIEPIKGFQETAAKTVTEANIAPWKETVSQVVRLKDGSTRTIVEEKINKEKALNELVNNGSFDWVADRTSYDLANQTWVDRMGMQTIFDNNDPAQVAAVKQWLANDTVNNVIDQSKLIADTIAKPEKLTVSEKQQAKISKWWDKNSDNISKQINKITRTGKIDMPTVEKVFESYGFNVKGAYAEVDGQKFLNAYIISNPKYGKAWNIRIEADDDPQVALSKIAGQFTEGMQQFEPKKSLPSI